MIMQMISDRRLSRAAIPQAEQERKKQMRDAWKAYKGEFPRPLVVKDGQPDDNVISNRCSPIVNKGASFLFGQTLKIEAKDQDFIDGLWKDDDDRMTLLSQMAINGGVCGEVFLKIIPAQGTMKYPRIVVMDPLLVRMVTSSEDCTLVLAYVIEYPGGGDMQKRQIIARMDPDGTPDSYQIEDTWTITDYARKGDMGEWYQAGEREEWLYPFPPILCCQNLSNPNESWGMPDLTPDLIGQNSVLNFIQSNTSRIIKFHGHPKTYATGINASQINIGVDDLICLPSPDSKLANLEMQSNLESSLNFAATIRSDMDEQSRVPAVALGRQSELPGGTISGIALQLMFQPLIEKTIMKQRLYGRLIREVTRAALVLAGVLQIEEFEDYPVELHWQNLLPVDNLAAAQESLLLKQLGVSDATILSQLGYDAEEEAEKSAKEDEQKISIYQSMPPMQQAAGQPQNQEAVASSADQQPIMSGGTDENKK